MILPICAKNTVQKSIYIFTKYVSLFACYWQTIHVYDNGDQAIYQNWETYGPGIRVLVLGGDLFCSYFE